MKKEYINPQTDILQIEMQSMVAATTFNGQEGNDNVNIGTSEEEYNGGGGSRYYDDWDD